MELPFAVDSTNEGTEGAQMSNQHAGVGGARPPESLDHACLSPPRQNSTLPVGQQVQYHNQTMTASPPQPDYMNPLPAHGYDMSSSYSSTSAASSTQKIAQVVTSSIATTSTRVMTSVWNNLRSKAPSKIGTSAPRAPASGTTPVAGEFAYINVWEMEDEVDVRLPEGVLLRRSLPQSSNHGDVLQLLLQNPDLTWMEEAQGLLEAAHKSKMKSDWAKALEKHSTAAKLFYDAAVSFRKRDHASLARLLFSLSQIQARSALSLKKVVQLSPTALAAVKSSNQPPQIDRLRATVRGALEKNSPQAADLSESTFLGRAVNRNAVETRKQPTDMRSAHPSNDNPVDEMMALERELRDMEIMGSSVVSLDSRRGRNMDGSFMVVGANSYMSSSNMWSSSRRSRPNRVQPTRSTGVGASLPIQPSLLGGKLPPAPQGGLVSSWMQAGQVPMTSSIASLACSMIHPSIPEQGGHAGQHQAPANTKQLMRLMDSLKSLGDENAALLRQVEGAEAARAEAKMAHEEMRRFKDEYSAKFKKLREALKTFRKEHPGENTSNPVVSSGFAKTASGSDKFQRQEQLIRKLTSDLRKEKEESRKKDAVLRKYETFYKTVKARSARKAAQRKREKGKSTR